MLRVESSERWEVVAITQDDPPVDVYDVEVRPKESVYIDWSIPDLPQIEGDFEFDLTDGFFLTDEGTVIFKVVPKTFGPE